MSDSTQQYILKQPITIQSKFEDYKSYPSFVASNSEHAFELPKCPFDEVFVPLDIPAIEEQLEKITEKIYYLGVKSGRGVALWPEEESYIDDETFNGEILGLFGLENKETEE